ncbi:MAG: polysaccharide deacetylase family protein [Beijerinckiaceae bacterium]|nr:polysaccharide deacetylase family protein [Beijerinckiaceae bacterium]
MKRRLIHFIFAVPTAAALLLASGAARGASCPPDALGVSRILEIGTSGGLQVGLKTYPRSLALADHELVLTFDDGPAAGTTPKVLDTLATECVKATFFLVGRNADTLPLLVKRTSAEGHTIAHHTFSHPDVTMRGLSDSAARADIVRGFAADDKAAFGAAGSAPKVPFFRFPGFADTPELLTWLSSQNIAVFGADFWASDWALMTPEAQLRLVLERLEKEQRGILLFHDTRPQTAAMLPEFLRELKKRGYRIVHIVPGSGPAPVRDAPDGWTSATEKIIAEVFAKQNRAAKPQGAASSPAPAPATKP